MITLDSIHNGRVYIGTEETKTGARSIALCENAGKEYGEANARRIVACVNACEGISTEYMEGLTNQFTSIDRVVKERIVVTNQLLRALKKYEKANRDKAGIRDSELYQEALEAIAAASKFK